MRMLIGVARAVFIGLFGYAGLIMILVLVSIPGAGQGFFGGLEWLLLFLAVVVALALAGAGLAGIVALRAAGTEPTTVSRVLRIVATVAAVVASVVGSFLVLSRGLTLVLPLVASVPLALAVTAIAAPRQQWARLAATSVVLFAGATVLLLPGSLADSNADRLRETRMTTVTQVRAVDIAASLRASGWHPVAVWGYADYWGDTPYPAWPRWGMDGSVDEDVLTALADVGSPRVRFLLAAQCIGTPTFVIHQIELNVGSIGDDLLIRPDGDSSVPCDGSVHVRRFVPVDIGRGPALDGYGALAFDRETSRNGDAVAVRWALVGLPVDAPVDEGGLAQVATAAFGATLE
jgi:hypothetical protein